MYYLIKLLHVLPAVIFLGNIFIGMFWMIFAVQSNDQKLIHFAIKTINKLDKLLTIPSVIFIVVFGFVMMFKSHYPFFETPWIHWSSVLILISGLIFGLKLTPIQIRLEKLTADQNLNKQNFKELYKSWLIWGTLALITPIIAFIMMILKFPN